MRYHKRYAVYFDGAVKPDAVFDFELAARSHANDNVDEGYAEYATVEREDDLGSTVVYRVGGSGGAAAKEADKPLFESAPVRTRPSGLAERVALEAT